MQDQRQRRQFQDNTCKVQDIDKRQKEFLMKISSFGQVPFTFSKSKSQDTFQEDQISEDS
jgi:hypothetical protein